MIQSNYILFFNYITLGDIARVGGKNASLGQMYRDLSTKIRIPNGFAVTVDAYRAFLESVPTAPGEPGFHDAFMHTPFSDDLTMSIIQAYKSLSDEYQEKDLSVAVRSSATSEDLPGASFAGQQDSFLHISGESQLLYAVKKCMVSLFNERAIAYRQERGFDNTAIGISVGVQKMINADDAVSGVMFTLETESGHKDFVTINASYGLGETIVGGMVNPDEFMVHKPTFLKGYMSLVKKECGDKKIKALYSPEKEGVIMLDVPDADRMRFSLNDEQIAELTRYALYIEDYFSSFTHDGATVWTPMDIEWAQDSIDKKIYIVQARPETIHGSSSATQWSLYTLTETPQPLPVLTGLSIGKKIASGSVTILTDAHQASHFKDGDVLVTSMTDPDWVPVMKRASAIITEQGGRTCHAAIIARELGVTALVGVMNATSMLTTGERITVDCSKGAQGFIYKGDVPFTVQHGDIPKATLPVELMVNIAHADRACEASLLPVEGAGLVRLEFIIAQHIGIHPMAILFPEKVSDSAFTKRAERECSLYGSLANFYEEVLACNIGLIAAAFYPRPVVIRLTDFKSNEYSQLLGGSAFEPDEENPMLGFRGAARYTSPLYAPAFALECAAIRRARNLMGFDNIIIMVPFVRTVAEAQATINALAEHGLERGVALTGFHSLLIYLMVELPANVILLESFSPFFDGFSLGSNDLTQLTLGVDRDSALIKELFDERNPAVTYLIHQAIIKAHAAGKHISICGQGPSDSPDFAQWLMDVGIDTLSMNIDAVIPFIRSHAT